MPNLDDLNKRANERFEQIKSSSWVGKLFIGSTIPITAYAKNEASKLEKMLEEADNKRPSTEDDKEQNKVKSIMEAIDALNLPPNLSIAVSYLVVAQDKDREINLQKAIEYISEEFMHG